MYLRSKYLFLLIFFSCCFAVKADDSTDIEPEIKYRRIEALMNVSNALSRFTGNGNVQTVFEEPFLMGMKISNRAKTAAIRIGINFSISNITEDLNGISKVSNINAWAPLVGYEWRKELGYRFQFYGGVDLRYYNDINRTETRTPTGFGTTSVTIFKTSQTGWGFGPFCGFAFHLTPRITFLTEGNFYLNYIHKLRSFSGDGTRYETFEDKYVTSLSPSAPSALFLLVRF